MENELTTETSTTGKHQTVGANGNLMTAMNYAENQWSPLNQTGKKYYNREQLFKINNKSICKTRPKYLQETNVTLKEVRMTMFKPTTCEHLVRNEAGISNRIVIKLLPNFARTNNTSQQQTQHNQQPQNTFTKRNNNNNNNAYNNNNNNNSCNANNNNININDNNNDNNINNIDNNNNMNCHNNNNNNYLQDKNQDVTKESAKHLINVSLSLNEDIKLSKSHNAWKSSYLKKNDEQTKDQYITQELYKSVRSILNKLTPEKLEALLKQMNELSIDSPERLNGVINLIFEKATDEPKFSFSYALLCNSLLNIEFPEYDTCFRKSLINKCQTEFLKYTNFTAIDYSNCSTNSIDNVEEDDKAKIRRRMVGTVCFIGELYKIQIMTSRVMLTCIKILLISKDEDCLEYLCKLLTTIGGNIEEGEKLTSYFNQILDIVNKTNKLWAHIKISSRIRFMLLNVLELRNNGWTPRQPVMNPKKMEQIQQEAETERLNIELRNATPVTEKRDGNSSNNDSGNRNHQNNEDNQNKSISVDTNKFRTNFTIDDNTTLGSQSMFRWNKTKKNESTDTSNRYEILSEIDNTATENSNYHKKDQRNTSNREKHINRRGRSLQPSLERISKRPYSKDSTLHTNYYNNNVK